MLQQSQLRVSNAVICFSQNKSYSRAQLEALCESLNFVLNGKNEEIAQENTKGDNLQNDRTR